MQAEVDRLENLITPTPTGQTMSWRLQSRTSTSLRLPWHSIYKMANNLFVVQAEVDRLENLIDAYANRADYVLEAAEQNIDSFEAALEQQERRQEHRKQAALQRQRQALAKAAAQEMVNERRQRMASLRQVSLSEHPNCLGM